MGCVASFVIGFIQYRLYLFNIPAQSCLAFGSDARAAGMQRRR